MAQDGFGTSPFILPNMFQPPGVALDNTIDRQERERLRRYEIEYREQQRQNQYRLFNIREIDQDTDPKKFRTGRERFDRYSQSELLRIKNNALARYVNLPPEEAKYLLGKDMEGLVQWHTAVSGKIDEIETGLKDFNKTFSNVNPIEAHEMAFLNLGNDYLKRDETGALQRVNPSIIQPKNYVEELLKPENISQLSIDTTPFQKAIESIPKTSVGDKEYVSKKGFSHKFNWSGLKTDYSDIVEDEKGRPVKFELKSDRKVGDMKLIPEDLKEYLMSQPNVKLAADRLWENEKRKIVQSTQTEIDPRTEGELKDAFLYNMADKYLPHDIRKDVGDVTPKPTVNFYNIVKPDYSGGGSKTGNEIDTIETPSLPKQNGITYDPETKQPMNRNWDISRKNIPGQLRAIIKAGGIDLDDYGDKFTLSFKDGFIQELRTIKGELVLDRDDVQGKVQPRYNTNTKQEGVMPFGENVDKGGAKQKQSSQKKKEYKGLDSKGNPIFE